MTQAPSSLAFLEKDMKRIDPRLPFAREEAPPLLKTILTSLEESKAEEIVVLDLLEKSSLTDFMVVASGGSARHVSALADKLVEALSAAGHPALGVEGVPQCDWVLVDAGSVMIHLFRPEVRLFYQIETLWSHKLPAE